MRYALSFLIFILLGFLVIDFNNRASEYNRLKAEKERVGEQFLIRQGTKAALETEWARANSEAAVEEYGYTNRLVRPGDHLVVIVQSTAIPTPSAPTPIPTARTVSNPETWLSLFFDLPSP